MKKHFKIKNKSFVGFRCLPVFHYLYSYEYQAFFCNSQFDTNLVLSPPLTAREGEFSGLTSPLGLVRPLNSLVLPIWAELKGDSFLAKSIIFQIENC